jgi:hypothetical protein
MAAGNSSSGSKSKSNGAGAGLILFGDIAWPRWLVTFLYSVATIIIIIFARA